MHGTAGRPARDPAARPGADCIARVPRIPRTYIAHENARTYQQHLFLEKIFSLLFFRMASSHPSVEARMRRNQKREKDASGWEEDSSARLHLLPTPCLVREESYQYRCVALDCKMIAVEATIRSDRNLLASVGIMDIDGVPLYEAYVPPPGGTCVNWRSRMYCPINDRQFDIARHRDGTDFESVRSQVLGLFRRSKFVIGHAIRNDFKCLRISVDDLPDQVVIDIQQHYKQRALEHDFTVHGFHLPPLRQPGDVYGLRTLALHLLDEEVQQGDHSAIEDARTTMKLYVLDQFKIEEPERLRNMEWWAE